MAGESGERGPGLFASLKAGIGGVFASLRALGRTLERRRSPVAFSSSAVAGRERIEEAKCDPPPLFSPIARQELPRSYGHSRVTLTVVDPYLIHADWDIDTSRLPPDTSSAALRFHDVSGPSSAFFEVDVDLRARNWYVHLLNPARSYYADLGVRTAQDGFVSLAASNRVQTPRAWPVAESRIAGLEPTPPAIATAATAAAPVQSRQSLPAETPHVEQAFLPAAPAAMHSDSGQLRDISSVVAEAPITNGPQIVVTPKTSPEPRPVDAAHVLQQKLEEIYALRPWKSPRVAVQEATWPDPEPWSPGRPVASGFAFARIHGAAPRLRAAAPFDLTALAEHRFHRGLPSSISPASNPKSPTG